MTSEEFEQNLNEIIASVQTMKRNLLTLRNSFNQIDVKVKLSERQINILADKARKDIMFWAQITQSLLFVGNIDTVEKVKED